MKRIVVLVTIAALAVVAALTASVYVASGGTAVRVSVSPALSALDQPIRIAVHGLAPGELATMRLRSVDSTGISWASVATFRADGAGTVDLDAAAPVSGAYSGVWGMGLIAMMRSPATPTRPDPARAYFWHGTKAQTFQLSVRSQGRELASKTFRRRLTARPVRIEQQQLSDHGFVGEWFAPSHSGRRPAVLAIGGSEGGDLGLFLDSDVLAANDYPTLDIAYFKAPGLPNWLANIRLEYFAKALQWLRRQPGVDPSRIIVLGASRGSEAAQLLGVYYPNLVHAVIATSPANVALCDYPFCVAPAWTLHGKPLPYTHQLNDPHPTDNPAAVIPVERIQGPIFLACGGKDTVWVSCEYAHAIMNRLDDHHDRYPHVLQEEPKAGHHVDDLTPYEPLAIGNDPADEMAREKIWPHFLRFLAAFAHAPR